MTQVQHDAEGSAKADARGPVHRPLPALVVIALFLVAMLASAIAGTPRIELSPEQLPPLPQPDRTAPAITPGVSTPDQSSGSDLALVIIGILLVLIITALLVVALIWLIRTVLDAWRRRPLRATAGAETDVAVVVAVTTSEAEPDVPLIRRGIAAARTAIQAPAEAGDAIVAAWVGLEETAADSGVGRGTSETPAEFALRMLLRRPAIEEPAQLLLALYEGVRFGGHVADEGDRAQAVRALALIEDGWR